MHMPSCGKSCPAIQLGLSEQSITLRVVLLCFCCLTLTGQWHVHPAWGWLASLRTCMPMTNKSINEAVTTNQNCAMPGFTSGVYVDWGSVITEDATQNAALAAIMFLAGGLGKSSPHCIITLVGSDPVVRPLLLDQQQAQQMLQTRANNIGHEEVSLHVLLLVWMQAVGLQSHAAAQLCHSG